MSDPQKQLRTAALEALGHSSRRLLEYDDYASFLEADLDGRRVRLVYLNDLGCDRPELSQTFLQHTEAIGSLGNDAFLRVIDSASADTSAYVVYEPHDGVVIDDLCAGSLPTEAVAQLGAALAAAVETLHAEGLTHGDLTPRGVVVSPRGLVRVSPVSLGCIARSVPPRRLARRLAYQAPEALARAALEVDPSADVYSLGVILWEALCGRPLVYGNSLESFVSAARAVPGKAKLDKVVPPALATSILRALDPTPSRRPPAAELRQQLANIAGAGSAALAAAAKRARPPTFVTGAANPRAWALPKGPSAADSVRGAVVSAQHAPPKLAAQALPPPPTSRSRPPRPDVLPRLAGPPGSLPPVPRVPVEPRDGLPARRGAVTRPTANRNEVSMSAPPGDDDDVTTGIWKRPSTTPPPEPAPEPASPPPVPEPAREPASSSDSASWLEPVAVTRPPTLPAGSVVAPHRPKRPSLLRRLFVTSSIVVIALAALIVDPTSSSRRAVQRVTAALSLETSPIPAAPSLDDLRSPTEPQPIASVTPEPSASTLAPPASASAATDVPPPLASEARSIASGPVAARDRTRAPSRSSLWPHTAPQASPPLRTTGKTAQ